MTDICIVTTDAISFNVLYRGQLEFLKKQGHELTLICGGSYTEVQKLHARNVGNVVHIDLVRPPRPFTDLKALFQLFRFFRRHRYETIIVTTPKAILLGAIASWITCQPRRVVFFQGRVYENFSGITRFFYSTLDKISAWCAHELIFVSKSLMEEYRRDANIPVNKGHVLGQGSCNGVCAKTFDPSLYTKEEIEDSRSELGILQDAFVVLVVGRLCIDKGLSELNILCSRAALEDKSTVFLLVGPIENGLEEQVSQLVSKGNVVHIGFTPNIAKYFALADIHLFLTHREGFGNVAIEAAAMGLPTIAFDVVGVRDSVCHGVSGIRVPFGDIDAIWDALQDMKKEHQAKSQKYAKSREWALDLFEQKKVWNIYADFYSRELDSNSNVKNFHQEPF